VFSLTPVITMSTAIWEGQQGRRKVKVTDEIKRRLKDKDMNIADGREAMLNIMKDLHGQTMNELGRAALGSWDSYYLKNLLNTLEDKMAEYESKATAELSGLLNSAWGKGVGLVDAAFRAVELSAGGFRISTGALDVLKDYSNGYLEKMFGDAWHGIKGEITLGMLGAKTPQEVAKAIGMTIDSGKFGNIALRAETITQTEMGRIFSAATQFRMTEAAAYVDGLEKQWIHAGHPHMPRISHVMAHGQHVPVDQPFKVGGLSIMHPRHPNAPISEVIHCGCDHVPYHASWNDELKDAGFVSYGTTRYEAVDNFVRQGLKTQEFRDFYHGKRTGNFPVATLDNNLQKELTAKSDIVMLSNETLSKNKKNHPDLTIRDYRHIPDIINNSQIVIEKEKRNLVFIERGEKDYFAVVKAVHMKNELYLTSFRFTNEKDIINEMKKGRLIKNVL